MTSNPLPQLNDTDSELLSAYIDRQLPDAARTLLETRLGQEPTLRAALDELRTTVAALRAIEPVRPPRSFTLDPATVQRPATQWWRSLVLPFGGLAAALFVALVLMSGLLRSGSPASMTVASAPTFAPTAAPAQLNAQTVPQPTQVAAPTLAPPAAAAAPVPLAPAAAAPAPGGGAAEAAVPTLAVPNDTAVDGGASASRSAATALPLPTSEPPTPFATPAISSTAIAPVQQAPTAPPPPQSGLPVLPIVLILVLVGAIVAGMAWMRRRNK